MTAVIDCIDISTLYHRLKQIGFSDAFVRHNGLPEWWTEECETLSDAPVTVAAYLSRRFNLDFQSLLNPELAPRFKQCGPTRYKTTKQTVSHELSLASHLARQIAELVSFSSTKDYRAMVQDPSDRSIAGMTAHDIRKHILEQAENSTVTLSSLLNFCDVQGIPVVHFAQFPKTVKKFYGMVTRCGDNPVIIVSLNDLSPSRLAFILAHELGHLALNHLKPGETISDEEIKLDDLQDDQESAANEFAAELILGSSDKVYYFPQNMNAKHLAQIAREKGLRDRVDPGAIAWNYGWYKKSHFGVSRAAVKLIEQDANAPRLINERLQTQLDWERLSDDNQEYLALALALEDTRSGG